MFSGWLPASGDAVSKPLSAGKAGTLAHHGTFPLRGGHPETPGIVHQAKHEILTAVLSALFTDIVFHAVQDDGPGDCGALLTKRQDLTQGPCGWLIP